MNKNDELNTLIKIARMYYEQNLTQAQIAKSLGIYRTTISRLLKKVRDDGIVKIAIDYSVSDTFLLEEEMKSRFGLEHIILIAENKANAEQQLKMVGLACANFLKSIVEDGHVIGFSWGSSLAAVAEQLDSSCHKDVLCLPMVGGPAGRLDSKYHVNTIVYKVASKLHGKSLLMDFPARLDEAFIREGILKSQHYNQIADYWHHLDIALFGIGSPVISDNSMWRDFYGQEGDPQFKNPLIVGDICSRFYDIKGQVIDMDLHQKIINIELDLIKKVPYRIGVAISQEKTVAILGAINGGYINSLITTKETAQGILNEINNN